MTHKREAVIVETTRNIAEQIVDLAYLASGNAAGNPNLNRLFLVTKLLDMTNEIMIIRESDKRRAKT